MNTIWRVLRSLYRDAQILWDVQAIAKGPRAVLKRA